MANMSKAAFGSKDNIETAKSTGTIDEYDVLYLDNGEIGWIDKNKNTVISTTRTQEDIEVNGVTGLGIENGGTIPSGKSLDEIVKMLVQKAVPPTYTAPTVTLVRSGDGTASGNYEAGTSITPVLTATFNKNDAGDLTKLAILKGSSEVGSDTSSPYTYTGEAIVLGDETVTFKAQATYGDGDVKNNNLGTPDATGQIKAGTKDSSNFNYVGQRNAFWGYGTGTMESPTSDQIRGLANKRLNPTAGSVISVAIATGSQHIIFALPAPRTLTQVSYDDLGDKGMLSAFTHSTVQVADARGGVNGLKDYNVYLYNMSTPSAATMNFSFTIG